MKILKGEELFNKDGLHIIDTRGIAIKADQDTECEISSEHVERVRSIVSANRLAKGLDEEGNEIKKEEPTIELTTQE